MTLDEIVFKAARRFLHRSDARLYLDAEEILALVDTARTAEREACALIAESYEPQCESCPRGVANAIRHRGSK